MEGLVEVSNKVDTILGELFNSFEKCDVKTVFDKYGVGDPDERIRLLQKCMEVTDTSDTDQHLSAEDRYADELEIFIYGRWRFLI
ncbi:MAG: hypothetical protein LBK66_13470 [Spirochaetaceae bacterium]|jgi:hypothetical protein|nr:hypothetical protein [Spirochaetaceae bacterium]